jgi:flagellar protein FliO/FliZ
MIVRWLPIFLLFSETLMAADAVQEKIAAKASSLGSETLFQTAGGLLLVLALILVGAWLFKRFGHLSMGARGPIKVLGGVSVGARERVVLIEVESIRLLLGVAPGQVRTLHRLPMDERAFRHAFNLAQDEHRQDKDKQKPESQNPKENSQKPKSQNPKENSQKPKEESHKPEEDNQS